MEGLLPKRPSRRVWFAVEKGYAQRRAKTQARRRHDRPVVLKCNLNLGELRSRYGIRRVICRAGVIAIDGWVPVGVLSDFPASYGAPLTPEEIAQSVNQLLQIPAHKGAGPRHAGTERLFDWLERRRAHRPRGRIRYEEFCERARQAFPELFSLYAPIDAKPRRAKWSSVPTMEVESGKVPEIPPDPRENTALQLLEDEKPEKRIRGLRLLQRLRDPDLSDWCAIYLEDRSPQVVEAALRIMGTCEEGDPEVVLPFVSSEDRAIRAGAMGALAAIDTENQLTWIEEGLRDPEPCVRLAVLPILESLDPKEHRRPFELALHDPNDDVRRRVREMTRGKGFHEKWRS